MCEMAKEEIWIAFMNLSEEEQFKILNALPDLESMLIKPKFLPGEKVEEFVRHLKQTEKDAKKIAALNRELEEFDARHIWARWDPGYFFYTRQRYRALFGADDLLSLASPYESWITTQIQEQWNLPEFKELRELITNEVRIAEETKKASLKSLEDGILKDQGLEDAGTFTWVRMCSKRKEESCFVAAGWVPSRAISLIKAFGKSGLDYREAGNPRWIYEIFEAQGFYLHDGFVLEDVNKAIAKKSKDCPLKLVAPTFYVGEEMPSQPKQVYFLSDSADISPILRRIRYDAMNNVFCKY